MPSPWRRTLVGLAGIATFLLAPAQALGERGAPAIGWPLQLEAGLWQGDLWGGAAAGLRVRHGDFALEFSVPLWLRLTDLAPATPRPAGPCAQLRCERLGLGPAAASLLQGGPATPALLGEGLAMFSRTLVELRLGEAAAGPGLRVGPMVASLGHGALVDHVLSGPDPDAPSSGLFARARVPLAPLEWTAFVADIAAPLALAGARLTLHPFAPASAGATAEDASRRSLAGRLALAGEVAVDGEAFLDARAPPAAAAFAIEASWPLLPDAAALHIDPYCALGASLGLRASDASSPGFGGGGHCGARIDLGLRGVALRLEGAAGLDGPAYRSAYFSPLYLVERHLAWGAPGTDDGPKALLPAPGGLQGRVGAELGVGPGLRAGARYARDAALGSATLEAFARAEVSGVRLAGRLMRRRAEAKWAASGWGFDDATLGVLESSMTLVGPLSAYLRYWRMPRIREGRRVLEHDVMAGISLDWELRRPGPPTP